MKVTVLQENLARGLSIVGRAVETRATMPVLTHVLLETEEARLKLAAVNMSLGLGITAWIGANVSEAGAFTLPAKTISDLVNNLSPERVEMTLSPSSGEMHIRCGGSKANLKGMSADEFPPLPDDDGGDLAIPAKDFKEMIQHTVFAAATEDDRPILTGVYTRVEGNMVTMAAADGYRLAVRTLELEHDVAEAATMIIPAKALAEVARIISDDDSEVLVTLPGARDIVMFRLQHVNISAQLLEGNFPDFMAIVPKAYSTATKMFTADLLRACQRAEIFARDSAYSGRLFVKPPKNPGEPGEVLVAGKSAERGDNEGMIDATVEGEPLDISFNIRYLIEVLRVISEPSVVFESNGPGNPGVIRPEDREDFIHVIMPMSNR